MIELLGVGVPRGGGGWLLRRVCATFEAGQLTLVAGGSEERDALLDAIAGHAVPPEGRIWVSRVPVMRETLRRVRGLVADVAADGPTVDSRSLLWNVLAPSGSAGALRRLLRLPRPADRLAALVTLERLGLGPQAFHPAGALAPEARVRLLVARELARRPRHLLVRDPGRVLGGHGLSALLATLRRVARDQRVCVVASAPEAGPDVANADGVLHLVAPEQQPERAHLVSAMEETR